MIKQSSTMKNRMSVTKSEGDNYEEPKKDS